MKQLLRTLPIACLLMLTIGSAVAQSDRPYYRNDNRYPDRNDNRYPDRSYGNNDPRSFIGQVQQDLRQASRLNVSRGRERERYDNAQRHLSDFDRQMSRGRFDKDKLDVVIEDIQNVVSNNSLSPRDRDNLSSDLSGLRRFRETRGASF